MFNYRDKNYSYDEMSIDKWITKSEKLEKTLNSQNYLVIINEKSKRIKVIKNGNETKKYLDSNWSQLTVEKIEEITKEKIEGITPPNSTSTSEVKKEYIKIKIDLNDCPYKYWLEIKNKLELSIRNGHEIYFIEKTGIKPLNIKKLSFTKSRSRVLLTRQDLKKITEEKLRLECSHLFSALKLPSARNDREVISLEGSSDKEATINLDPSEIELNRETLNIKINCFLENFSLYEIAERLYLAEMIKEYLSFLLNQDCKAEKNALQEAFTRFVKVENKDQKLLEEGLHLFIGYYESLSSVRPENLKEAIVFWKDCSEALEKYLPDLQSVFACRFFTIAHEQCISKHIPEIEFIECQSYLLKKISNILRSNVLDLSTRQEIVINIIKNYETSLKKCLKRVMNDQKDILADVQLLTRAYKCIKIQYFSSSQVVNQSCRGMC